MSATPAVDRLEDANEIAAYLGVPVTWVRAHTRAGYIPHVELGRYKRYRRSDVDAWIKEQERGGAPWRKHAPKGRHE